MSDKHVYPKTYTLRPQAAKESMDESNKHLRQGASVTVNSNDEYGTTVIINLPGGQSLFIQVDPDYKDNPEVRTILFQHEKDERGLVC